MNNHTSAREKLREGERTESLVLQILGLTERVGHGQFTHTPKFELLLLAIAREHAGEMLLHAEEQLLSECELLILRR